MSTNKITTDYLNKLVERGKILEQELEEANVTSNLDGGSGPPSTPFIFQKNPPDDSDKRKEDEIAMASGAYTIRAEEIDRKAEEIFKKYEKSINRLDEISYISFKSDDTMSPKQKVNNTISNLNKSLYEMERTLKQNVKLRQEIGIDQTQYWKSTGRKFKKIQERLGRIGALVREMMQ